MKAAGGGGRAGITGGIEKEMITRSTNLSD